MKLKKLNLQSFGKFTGKEIALEDGINVFYGENETGKSTVFAFIRSMLFGMERGRGKAAQKDVFSQYEPWHNPNHYAGKLWFTTEEPGACGGEKCFCLSRHFDKYGKKAELYCENDGEEFSIEHGDLDMLLGGLTQTDYDNTIAIRQLKAETDQNLAKALRNYAANYYTSGNSEIDLEQALLILREKQKIEEKSLRMMGKEKEKQKEKLEQEADYMWRELQQKKGRHMEVEQEISLLQKRVGQLSREEVQNRQLKKQYSPKMRENNTNNQMPQQKGRLYPVEVIAVLLLVVLLFVCLPQPWNSIVSVVIALAEALYVWNRLKDRDTHAADAWEEQEDIEEHNEENDKADRKTEKEIIQKELERLHWEQARLDQEIKDRQIAWDNIREKLAEFYEVTRENKEQKKKAEALQLAQERLLRLSGNIQKEISVQLNERASSILQELTCGKYIRLIVEDDMQMYVLTEDGRIGIERLSRGTMEQIYFALRMAAAEVLYDEEYPVILDDTFAYYDEERLRSVLFWLYQNKKQVLLFTCHKREQEILAQMHIPYRNGWD